MRFETDKLLGVAVRRSLFVFLCLALTSYGCADGRTSSELRASEEKAGVDAGGTGGEDEDDNLENKDNGENGENGDDPTSNGDPVSGSCADNPKPFVSFWKVDHNEGGTVRLPIAPDAGDGEFDFTVDWGDGTPKDRVWNLGQRNAEHEYEIGGEYAITIEGHIGSAWSFKLAPETHRENNLTHAYLRKVEELGSVGWESLHGAFYQDTYNSSHQHCNKCNGHHHRYYDLFEGVAGGCTDEVTDMSHMFYVATHATVDTSTWDTSQVTSMANMFYGYYNYKADPDVSNWDFSSIHASGMHQMLYYSSGSFSVENYTTLLLRLADLDDEGHGLSYDVLNAELRVNTKYTAEAIGARAHLKNEHLFTINDGGLLKE